MKNQLPNKKPDYSTLSMVLIIAVLVFAIALTWVRYWELNEEITLISSNISEIMLSYNKSDKDSQESKDDSESQGDSDETTNSQPGVIDKKTILEMKSAGYYYSPQGDQLGIGPLPPRVDMSTNYWIFWEVDSFNADLEDLTVTAQLPENVIWTDKKSLLAGKLHFGQVTRRVIWTIDQVSQDGGPYRVGFEVGIIPRQNEVGRILDLVVDIQYRATDQSSQKEIQGTLDNITTDLIFDELATGQGEVVPFK
jgi:hypothetical protein